MRIRDLSKYISKSLPIVTAVHTNSGTKFEQLPLKNTIQLLLSFSSLSLSVTTHHNRTMAPPAPSRHQNFCASRRNGIFADPMTCDHYFSCSNTQTIVRECPGALYFQVTTEGDGFCDHKYNVKCKNGIRTILNAANAQKTIQATSNIQVPEVIRVLPTTNSIESSKHTEEQSSNIEAPNTTKKLNKIEESVNTIDSNNIEPSDNTEESNTIQLVVTTEESNNIESTNNIEETSSTETSDNNV